jgi:hypothetical protein
MCREDRRGTVRRYLRGVIPLGSAFLPSRDDETGPSCEDVPFAVKLTPLGALSLTSSAAAAC